MALSSSFELLALPREITSLICSYLSKPELKDVRLTCHCLARDTVPYLFDEIFVSFSDFNLRIANLVIRSFAPFIKTLIFSSIQHEDFEPEDFKTLLAHEDVAYGLDYQFAYVSNPGRQSDEQGRLAFLRYEVLRTARSGEVRPGKVLRFLTQALERLHNRQAIIMAPLSSSREISVAQILEHGDLPEASVLAGEALSGNFDSYHMVMVCSALLVRCCFVYARRDKIGEFCT